MKSFEIVSDTSHDLPEDYQKKHNIISVPFYIRLDDDNYLKEGVDIKTEEIYKIVEENPDIYPRTSLPSVEDYKLTFTEILDQDKDILCLTVASSLSGSYQSALAAKNILEDQYPNRRICLIDSRSATLGQGLLIKKAVEMRQEGIDLVNVYERLLEKLETTEIFILLDTLDYLEKGGRISKTKALAGKLLRIKPIVSFKNNILLKEDAVRGRKKAIDETMKLLHEGISGSVYDYEYFITHTGNEELAENMRRILKAKYNVDIEFDKMLVPGMVLSHIGPGAVAIGFTKK